MGEACYLNTKGLILCGRAKAIQLVCVGRFNELVMAVWLTLKLLPTFQEC